ncbi:hypothetical protein FHX74_003022 [Friedmanniella endophytica]|uniref:Uncharacterized protein n=1 Tax=Microlunatus kandeliicorticis TaxID=1759536 RepID=A0A7W3IU98_9ACTN|nr:hypothetical protein [Microlunatus kandeliicorticis]MBA8795386.1 hypothetical protein [Microlunatus kandeliicorticis]
MPVVRGLRRLSGPSARLLLVLLLGVVTTTSLGVTATPKALAAVETPRLASYQGSLETPVRLAEPDCGNDNPVCGSFRLSVVYDRVSALPAGELSAQLFGTASLTRVASCVTAAGVRRYADDVARTDQVQLGTSRGFPLTKQPGATTVTGQVFAVFGPAPVPTCAAGSTATLVSARIGGISLALSTIGEGGTTWTSTVPDRWSWNGRVTDTAPAPVEAGPLELDGYLLTLAAPTVPGAAASCPAVNGCGLLTFVGTPFRSGDRSTVLRGALKASGTVVRDYGCLTGAGRRLPRYASRVLEPALFNGGPGKVFTLFPDRDSTMVTLTAPLVDAQPGTCPDGTRAVLTRIALRDLTVTLVAFTNPEARTVSPVTGRWVWAGSVPTGS